MCDLDRQEQRIAQGDQGAGTEESAKPEVSDSEEWGQKEEEEAVKERVTARPTEAFAAASSPSELPTKGVGDGKPIHQRSLFHPSRAQQTVGATGSLEEPRNKKVPGRSPRGRGRGWKERLGLPAGSATAKVGRSQASTDGITVIEPLMKRLPLDQTEDLQTGSTSVGGRGQKFSHKMPSSALPQLPQVGEKLKHPMTGHVTPARPNEEGSPTPTGTTLPPETAAPTESEPKTVPEPAPVTQASKPKRYSSRRQRTGLGPETYDKQQQQQQQQQQQHQQQQQQQQQHQQQQQQQQQPPLLPQGLLICLSVG